MQDLSKRARPVKPRRKFVPKNATLTVHPNGVSAGFGGGNDSPVKRSVVTGWSQSSARRNTKFLQSVDLNDLFGVGVSITLTVGIVPPTHEHWRKICRAFEMRMSRAGFLRYHWVVEWTRRGHPHLHGVLFFETSLASASLLHRIETAWLDVSKEYGTSSRGQHIVPIDGLLGWLQYTAKHAARGAYHYQRERSKIPDGWQKTGRMWGKSGDWPVCEDKAELTPSAFFMFRRLMRSYLISDLFARARGPLSKSERKRLVYLRRSLKINDLSKSSVRPLAEWCPLDVSQEMLSFVHSATSGVFEEGYSTDEL